VPLQVELIDLYPIEDLGALTRFHLFHNGLLLRSTAELVEIGGKPSHAIF
jgi:hypothetical protein